MVDVDRLVLTKDFFEFLTEEDFVRDDDFSFLGSLDEMYISPY